MDRTCAPRTLLTIAVFLVGCSCSTGPQDADASRVDGAARDGAPSIDADGSTTPAIDAAVDAVSITIDPAMATLHVTDLTVPQTQAFVAHGHTADGADVVVPATWTVDRADVAAIGAATGIATTTNASGGDVIVTATYRALTATAQLRVVLEVAIALPDAPGDIATLFPTGSTPTTDAAHTASFVYPSTRTVFPQNVYEVLFQWRGGGNDRFRVNFDSDRVHLALYTTGVNATCTMAGTGLSCFQPVLDVWRYVAASNPHGDVTVTVDGARSSMPGAYTRSAPITIGFSRGPVPGAIYYWSTTARGIRRASVSDATPTNFLTPSQADGACVACHTLSRRGNRMAADVGGNDLWIVEVSPTFPPPRVVTQYAGANIPAFWTTFSFDETRALVAARGVLTLRDAATGAPINTVTIPGATHFGTQPDWAPDGTLVAFAMGATNRDRGVASARIATVAIGPGDTWGAVTSLVGTGGATDTNQYPSFSWNSQWIAYTHSTRNGENDVTTDLWLVARDGTGSRALARGNTIVADGVVSTPTIEDSMPTWAPSGVPDDYAWVAFTSSRDYGGVLSATSHLGHHKQLWVMAIDLAAAAAGGDPSFPAFRLPFTELTEDTHRPFWAEDRVTPPPMIDGGVPDAGMDAGTASDAGMCLGAGADCTRGTCCSPYTCWDDGSGTFTCQTVPM